jgi:hypothetical protein
MSSHPGTTLEDAVKMALWLREWHYSPEQVQDFYPTPGTISTVMYATGIHPLTGREVYVCRDYHEKQLQRALLQSGKPENAPLVREALRRVGRTDLIGFDKGCLVRPERGGEGRDCKNEGRVGDARKRGAARSRFGGEDKRFSSASRQNGRKKPPKRRKNS